MNQYARLYQDLRYYAVFALVIILLAMGLVTFVGCDGTTPAASTNISIVNTQTQNPLGTEPNTGQANGFTMTLDPSTLVLNQGSSASVKVIVTTPSGNEIHTTDLVVQVVDTDIATVQEIDGRFVVIKGMGAGETTALISANGLQQSLSIVVNP
jgi:hypothetical protein